MRVRLYAQRVLQHGAFTIIIIEKEKKNIKRKRTHLCDVTTHFLLFLLSLFKSPSDYVLTAVDWRTRQTFRKFCKKK